MKKMEKIEKFFKNLAVVDDSKLNTVDDIYAASMCRIAVIISIFIEFFELIMMVRIMILKSSDIFVEANVTSYFVSYLVLFSISILSQFIVSKLMKKFNDNKKKLLCIIYSYIVIILLWGLSISYLDLRGGQEFPAMVLLTIVAGVFTGVIGKPKVVIPMLSFLYISSNILFAYIVTGGTGFFHFAYFINSSIFFIIIGIVSIYNYNTKMREWTLRLEAKTTNARLAVIAETDSLTQLRNSVNLEACFTREALEYSNDGFKILCIQVDIDDFKNINNKCGHHIGDLVLIEVAKVLQEISKSSYRLGGDEFLITLPCMTNDYAISIINTVQEKLTKINIKGVDTPKITASIGAYFGNPKRDSNEIIKLVDDAVYYIKEKGKNDYYLITS